MLAGVDLAPVGLAAYLHTTGGTTAAPQSAASAMQNVQRTFWCAADNARGVFFGGFRSLGRIAPTVFMTSAPSGKPSGLPLPVVRSANLLGAALPLAGEDGSQNSNNRSSGHEIP